MLFSVIVTALNAGEKLMQTVDSVLSQSFPDYEIIVQDGGSKDGSADFLDAPEYTQDSRIRLFSEPDTGIYDGMNKAIGRIRGSYVLFLNCGDLMYDDEVLGKTAEAVRARGIPENTIFYGDVFERTSGQIVPANPKLDDFALFRNLPCHQACFYAADLFRERKYDLKYRVRADYEHFLWCCYVKSVETVPLGFTVASYEGGGFSETVMGRSISAREHREITQKYMPRGKVMTYRAIMILTLQPLREKLAQDRRTAQAYDKIKKLMYK